MTAFYTTGPNDINEQPIEAFWDDIRASEAPEEIDDDPTTPLPVRDSVSVEEMVAVVRGAR